MVLTEKLILFASAGPSIGYALRLMLLYRGPIVWPVAISFRSIARWVCVTLSPHARELLVPHFGIPRYEQHERNVSADGIDNENTLLYTLCSATEIWLTSIATPREFRHVAELCANPQLEGLQTLCGSAYGFSRLPGTAAPRLTGVDDSTTV